MVVEKQAAEFFQARVLAVTDTTLKVQTADEGDPAVVSRSDAYAVQHPGEVRPGSPAICNDLRTDWHACLVEGIDGDVVAARLLDASRVQLPRARVLSPTAVTTLNIRRAFERSDGTRRFAEVARGAGDPKRPHGWLPESREPVLAKRGADWYSAHVDGLASDGGVRVRWDGDEHAETVGADGIVPVPPFARAVTRGEFVLIRPATAAEAWRRVRIEAVGLDQVVAVNDQGEKIRVGVREIVPLGAAEAR